MEFSRNIFSWKTSSFCDSHTRYQNPTLPLYSHSSKKKKEKRKFSPPVHIFCAIRNIRTVTIASLNRNLILNVLAVCY